MILDRDDQAFVDICYLVSRYAHDRKRGHEWWGIMWARDTEHLFDMTARCHEGKGNPVWTLAHVLVSDYQTFLGTVDAVVEELTR